MDNHGAYNVIHEILHALGLHHEHNRPDRDNFVIILEENLKGEFLIVK